MSKHNVQILLFENSDTLDESTATKINGKGDSHLTELLRSFQNQGMYCFPVLADALVFGLPQERRRWYAMCMKTVGSVLFDFGLRPCKDAMALFRKRLQLCERQAPCATQLLYADDHPAIEAALNSRLKIGRANSRYNVGDVAATFKEHMLRYGEVEIPQFMSDSPWFGTFTNNMQQVVALSLTLSGADTVLARDISQSIRRFRHSKKVNGFGPLSANADGGLKHVMFTMMPEQQVLLTFESRPPRMLIGRESMLMQGFPLAKVQKLVETTEECVMMQLAGNMMATPVLLALLMSMFDCLVWKESSGACVQEDADNALQLFEMTVGGIEADDKEAEEQHPTPKSRDGALMKRRRL